MKTINLISIILLSIFSASTQNEYPKDFFGSPVNIKIAIAGTFGELRSNHFHSGIDIKTRQKKNIPIYASQDGYVSRIKVSPYGFGKAIYIEHEKGFTTVYAHLEKFNKKIQARTLKEHYQRENSEIDFALEKNEIKVTKGEIIGFSGNTGSSTGPHLHFEIRDTKTQKVINPMLFGFPILDTSFPIINSLLIYHQNGNKELIQVRKVKKNIYTINDTLTITGPFNVAINTYDLLDAAPNKNGVYEIQLYLNDSLYFSNTMNTFSFNETKYINAHIDYEYYKNHGVKFQKCFNEINNKLSTYNTSPISSLGKSLKNGIHTLEIIVKDSYNNQSFLEAHFEFKNHDIEEKKETQNIIRTNQIFEYEYDDCKIYIPNNSLYKDYPFVIEKRVDSMMQYPIYKILDDSIPSHKTFIISFKAKDVKKELREKTKIAKINDGNINCINSKWEDNKIIGTTTEFGEFTLVTDTIKPIIEHIKTDSMSVQFKIYDLLSDIAEYRGEIDGKWVLMEYDFKTNLIKHNFEEEGKNQEHEFNFHIKDHAGNINNINFMFFR